MKQFMMMLFGLLIMQAASAQAGKSGTFKKFKVDVSLGYATPVQSTGVGKKGGLLIAIEPKYNVMDQLAVGFRMEGAAMVRLNEEGEEGNAKINYSFLATGDYYFSNNKFRPFGGLGAGIYTFGSTNLDENTDGENIKIPTTSKFGVLARAGFEYGHLRVGVEYNILPDKVGYFGFKIGAVIGGGRK